MSDTEERNNEDNGTDLHEDDEPVDEQDDDPQLPEEQGLHDGEEQGEKETMGEKSKNPRQTDNKSRGSSKPASSRTSTRIDKKTQQMLAELHRLKSQMSEVRQSIHRPPVRPFTPDIFNSLSPYYNQYLVNSTIQDLQQELTIPRGYGHRPTALRVVDPEIAWKMDNFPNPVQQSRLPGRLFRSTEWSRGMSSSRDNQGSTRLPPLPMPSFPKFNQSSYQPNKMTYDELAHFREDLSNTYEKQAEKQAKLDYERTVQDWQRMNLSDLKRLPPTPRYHIKKAIVSYLGTSRGSSRAVLPLTKELSATTPEPIAQP